MTAMVNEANSPTRGSTPAMIEKEIASGISASATTRPASTSVREPPWRTQRAEHRHVGRGVAEGGGAGQGRHGHDTWFLSDEWRGHHRPRAHSTLT